MTWNGLIPILFQDSKEALLRDAVGGNRGRVGVRGPKAFPLEYLSGAHLNVAR